MHGTVDGDVESRDLIVGPNGTIKGNVRVDQADVQGKILEHIEARVCLSLRKTGRIEGSTVYGNIEIERGGVLSGEISVISASEKLLQPLQMGKAKDLSQHSSPRLVPTEAARSEGGPKSDVKKETQSTSIKK